MVIFDFEEEATGTKHVAIAISKCVPSGIFSRLQHPCQVSIALLHYWILWMAGNVRGLLRPCERIFKRLFFRVICTLRVETCSGTLKLVSKLVHPVSVWRSVTRPSKTTLRGVVLYWFYHQCNGCYRCRNRQRFYFTWYLPHNGSSKKFHETDHITRCNACWNLFRSAIARQFHLKVSTCNSSFIYEIALLCHV